MAAAKRRRAEAGRGDGAWITPASEGRGAGVRDGKPLLDPRALERLRARLRESSLVWGRALIALPAGGAAWERRFQAFALQRARLHEVGERLAPRAGRSRKEVLTSALLVEEVLDMF